MNRIATAIPEPILNNPTPQLINKSGLERLEIYKFVDEDGKHRKSIKLYLIYLKLSISIYHNYGVF